MENYKKPKTTIVSLSSEQAILEVCQVAGQLFNNATARICLGIAGPLSTCGFTAKGQSTTMVPAGLGTADSFQS